MNLFKFFGRKSTTVSVLDDTLANGDNNDERNDNKEYCERKKKIARSSAGLRRSEGHHRAQENYHESETKLFTEPLYTEISSLSSEVKGSLKEENPQNELGGDRNMRSQPRVVISEPSSHSISNHNDEEEQRSFNNPLEDGTATLKVPPGILHNKEKSGSGGSGDDSERMLNELNVQHMMALYAAIIKGDKSEVKKILTAYPSLVEAQDNFGRTPLMYCVLSDRLQCAKLLLKMRCELDQVDKAGRSALHLAAHKASYKILELLCERGGSIHLKDKDGQTPLHLTTRNRHPRCLDFLLRRLSTGFVDTTDNKNRSALHWSAAFNNVECIRLLLKHSSNVALQDSEGKTPLHWAANNHDPNAVACIKALLDSSPSVLNWQDYEGRTAIHYAVAVENGEVVSYLLNFKKICVVVDGPDNTFRTPLHWAAQLGNATIVKQLLDFGAKMISDLNGATPFLYAALNNNPAVVMEMIKHDASVVSHTDIEGRNALMWACGKGANDVIQALLELKSTSTATSDQHQDKTDDKDDSAGDAEPTADDADDEQIDARNKQQSKLKKSLVVDVNCTDNKGNTALHVASWNGNARSAELLLTYKARHDLQNNMNHTPLFGACEKGHLNVVKHLLDYNASIFLSDLEKRSPLHWAALGGHADVCDFLIQKGLHQDKQDSHLRSPLHCAAFGGFINCMNLLLEHGASVDLQDKEGSSALHWAAQSGHLDASKLLMQYNAFPNLMEFTEERLTPLDHALLIGRDDVAQYLMEQGAFSSETIRDIAAARIQAYYRGYKVRKDFLRRKNLLMEHEMKLRSRKDRNKQCRQLNSDKNNKKQEETEEAVVMLKGVREEENKTDDNPTMIDTSLISAYDQPIHVTRNDQGDDEFHDEYGLADQAGDASSTSVSAVANSNNNNNNSTATHSYSTVARPPPEGASAQHKKNKKQKDDDKNEDKEGEDEKKSDDNEDDKPVLLNHEEELMMMNEATDADVNSSVFISQNSEASFNDDRHVRYSSDTVARTAPTSVDEKRPPSAPGGAQESVPSSAASSSSSSKKRVTFDNEMLMSEYIEGMLSLSSDERRVLRQLQHDRKVAWLRANNAVRMIQRCWRDYAKRKKPMAKGDGNKIEALAVTFDNLPTTAGSSSAAEHNKSYISKDDKNKKAANSSPLPPLVYNYLSSPAPPLAVEKRRATAEQASGTSRVETRNKRVGTNTKVVELAANTSRQRRREPRKLKKVPTTTPNRRNKVKPLPVTASLSPAVEHHHPTHHRHQPNKLAASSPAPVVCEDLVSLPGATVPTTAPPVRFDFAKKRSHHHTNNNTAVASNPASKNRVYGEGSPRYRRKEFDSSTKIEQVKETSSHQLANFYQDHLNQQQQSRRKHPNGVNATASAAGYKPRIVATYRPTLATRGAREHADGSCDAAKDDDFSSSSSLGKQRSKTGGDERVGTARARKLRPTTVAATAPAHGKRVSPRHHNNATNNLLPNGTFVTSETQLQKIYGQLQRSYLYQPKKGVVSSTSFSYNMDEGNF